MKYTIDVLNTETGTFLFKIKFTSENLSLDFLAKTSKEYGELFLGFAGYIERTSTVQELIDCGIPEEMFEEHNVPNESRYVDVIGSNMYVAVEATNKPKLYDPLVTDETINALRVYLLKQRWDHSGGFPNSSLGEEELIFALAGLERDEIVSRGSCKTCVHSLNGHDRGYEGPCGSCKQPYHSHWKAK